MTHDPHRAQVEIGATEGSLCCLFSQELQWQRWLFAEEKHGPRVATAGDWPRAGKPFINSCLLPVQHRAAPTQPLLPSNRGSVESLKRLQLHTGIHSRESTGTISRTAQSPAMRELLCSILQLILLILSVTLYRCKCYSRGHRVIHCLIVKKMLVLNKLVQFHCENSAFNRSHQILLPSKPRTV